jgi:holliday junction DNA helicase RuvA
VIAQVSGTLTSKDLDCVHIMTAGGVAYELTIPLSAYEGLPHVGEPCVLHSHMVVKQDAWQLFGFASIFERRVFQRVLDAKGVGPSLAIGLISALSAHQLVRAIREKDVATLMGAPRVGRKKAEQLILDLAEKMEDLLPEPGQHRSEAAGSGFSESAIKALVSLGYSSQDAERAVKAALDDGGRSMTATELIRDALAKVTNARR